MPALLLLTAMGVHAQKSISTAAVRKFVQSMALIRQAPLSVQLKLQSHTDLPTDGEDEYELSGGIYLRSGSAYVQLGDTEQFMNDSVAVMINNDTKQMILLEKTTGSFNWQLPGMFAAGTADSTVKALGAIYTAVSNDSGVVMTTRALLNGAALPKENVQLTVSRKTGFPEEMQVTRRKLVMMDSLGMVELRDERHVPAERFMREGEYYHVVKEVTIRLRYEVIDRSEGTVPVTMAERLRKTAASEWAPVAAFADYSVLKQTN